MTDQERLTKIIRGLECLAYERKRDCDTCDYYDPWQHTCLSGQVASDALTLLRELEPRLLTLDEISETTVVYLECRAYSTLEPALSSGSYNDGTVGLITLDEETLFYLLEADYGIDWRCWSNPPTDEQREAISWQDKL